MPNIAKVLRDEMHRISRKEAKVAVAPVRKPASRLRTDVAALKRRLAELEKLSRALQARLVKVEGDRPAPASEEPADRAWISGRGIKSLRERLGLSQGDFARLVGVSAQAVYIWESKQGMLKLRDATKAAVFAARGIGAREAKTRLEKMSPKAAKAKKPAARRARRR